MSPTNPKKPKPRRRGRPLVVHPDDVQGVLDRLKGSKLKAEPEPGEKRKRAPKASGGKGKPNKRPKE